MGIIGEQLYAHSWGIDRSDISVKYKSLEKSYSNSQILLKDYSIQKEIELVIKEMADQVATRLRKKKLSNTVYFSFYTLFKSRSNQRL